jgi:hypothetical protein
MKFELLLKTKGYYGTYFVSFTAVMSRGDTFCNIKQTGECMASYMVGCMTKWDGNILIYALNHIWSPSNYQTDRKEKKLGRRNGFILHVTELAVIRFMHCDVKFCDTNTRLFVGWETKSDHMTVRSFILKMSGHMLVGPITRCSRFPDCKVKLEHSLPSSAVVRNA